MGIKMKISLCMGTYNGEKYIIEQLDCIRNQTRQPDEVIICDDNSKDNTAQLIEEYIDKYQLESNWRLYRNAENKGYPANFYYACSLCTGDIVFLADQDDIWDLTKIEKMCKPLEAQPRIAAICCKYGLVDAEGKDIHTLMEPTHNTGTGAIVPVNIEYIFYKNQWSGMAVAYRRKWYAGWSTGDYDIPHDILICARAAEEQAFVQMDEELVYHRRHDNNAAQEEHRIAKLLNKNRKLKEIEEYIRFLNAFAGRQVLQTKKGQKELQRKLISMQGRYDALKSGKISQVIKNAWKNRAGVRAVTVICDILIVKKK